mgnify:CR=1 FL=1
MTLLDKEAVKRVERKLKEFDEKIDVIILENSARTALEAASSLGCEVGAIVKSLLFKTEANFILCLIAGDKKASLNSIKKTINSKDVSLASAEDVKKVTGYTIGGVSPVGHLKSVDIYIDVSLKRFSVIFAAAGHPNCVFKTNFSELQNLTKGTIKEISE